jgi:hypothetical protein
VSALEVFHPAVSRWFAGAFAAPTEPQRLAWPAIAAGEHTLIAAPTGSGKTLAAFLAAIDALVRSGLEHPEGALPDATRVVYVSPLKALSNDVHRNLELPLAGIAAELERMGLPPVGIRTLVRTGDTPAAERAKMVKRPPHVLVTTPESLYILLGSDGGRSMLATASTAIVDEIHAVVGDKRGAHLALSLERLDELVGRGGGRLQRVGLSATQKPIEEVARFLTGAGRGAPDQAPAPPTCALVDVGHARDLDLALADAHRLQQHQVAADQPHDAQHPAHPQRQTAQMPARRQRTDKHVGVGRMPHHPHPVAQHRPAGKRRRGIDRQHPQLPIGIPLAILRHQVVAQRALARARRPGHPQHQPRLRPLGHALEQLGQPLRLIAQERHQLRRSPRLGHSGSARVRHKLFQFHIHHEKHEKVSG